MSEMSESCRSPDLPKNGFSHFETHAELRFYIDTIDVALRVLGAGGMLPEQNNKARQEISTSLDAIKKMRESLLKAD